MHGEYSPRMSTSDSLINRLVRHESMLAARNMTLVAVVLTGVYLFTDWAAVLLVCLALAGIAAGAWLTYFGVVNRAKPLISFALLAVAAFTLVDGLWTIVFICVGVFMGGAALSEKNSGVF